MMVNKILFGLFIGTLALIIFFTGWAVSFYEVGQFNLWLEQSIQQAQDKIQDSPDGDPEKDPQVIIQKSIVKGSEEVDSGGITFYPQNMIGLPALLIVNNNSQYVVARFENGEFETKTLTLEEQKLEGEVFMLEQSQLLMKQKKDKEDNFYSRIQFKNGKHELIWRQKIDQPFHHFGELFKGIAYIPSRTFFPMPDPEISKLFKDKPFSGCDHNNTMSDMITRLDLETGKVLEEIPLLPLTADIENPYLEFLMGHTCRDSLHLNEIQVLKTQKDANSFPGGKIGDMLVSLRNINTIMLVDKDTHKKKWSVTGIFHHQHSPRLTNRGTVILFDNLGSLPNNGLSRILEIDIKSREVVGIYEAQGEDMFSSRVRGRIQLIGDRIFIQEHIGGQFFELLCDEDQDYISSSCQKRLIFEMRQKNHRDRNFNVAEFMEI